VNVIIDGKAFQSQRSGGISRMFREILPRICDLDDNMSMTILTSGRCRATLPEHPQIRHHRLFPVDDILRPQRLWWPLLDPARDTIKNAVLTDLAGDLWHSTYYTRPSSWNGPTVVTVFDMIHERFPQFFYRKHDDRVRIQKKCCVGAADAVICISETTKRDVLERFRIDESKIKVIPLAASKVFKKNGGTEDLSVRLAGRPFILYVGDRSSYKNFCELIRAYSTWDRRTDVELVVVGPRWSREEQRSLRESGVFDRTSLYSSVDDQALCGLYNRALAFVYPSLYEGFGIPLLEAMACGCPVVASRIPTTIEIMGEQAIYFEPGQTTGLIGGLNTALREGRNSIRTKEGLETCKKYSWECAARMTLSVYCGVLGR
jgi:glycosyltransferase involved in cell wall biosynthesis